MVKKLALVLEGGGMRGAYTAGCLSWLLDEGIEFTNAYGISSGAFHLASFLMKNKDYLYDMSTSYIADKAVVGLRSLLRCGRIVDYDYMFSKIVEGKMHFDIRNVQSNTAGYVGIYSLNKGYTEYMSITKMDNTILKAAASLPIIGKKVPYGDDFLLDGGITEMIPIHPAIKDHCDKFLVITTKPHDYVRKPAKELIVRLMGLFYPQNDHQIAKDYRIRHQNYNQQIKEIEALVNKGDAFYRYPTVNIPVSRLRGDKEDLRKLYELGRSDMEKSRDAIYALLN